MRFKERNFIIHLLSLILSGPGLLILGTIVLLLHSYFGHQLFNIIVHSNSSLTPFLKASDGSAVIIIAIGVLLQGRGAILKWCGQIRDGIIERECKLDICSNYYGTVWLLVGLLMEVFAEFYITAGNKLPLIDIVLTYINLILYLAGIVAIIGFIIDSYKIYHKS
jgi:hypothetical protein